MKMKQPIHLPLPAEISSGIKNTRVRPPLSRYYVHYAPCQIIPLPESPIVRQAIAHRNFHMQLMETEAARDVEVKFSVLYPSIFAVFVRDGNIGFFNAEDEMVSYALQGTYYVCYCDSGNLSAKVSAGPHRIVVVALDVGWLLSEGENLLPLTPLFTCLENHDTDVFVLPHCAIGQSVYYHLESIRTCTLPAFERGAEIVGLLSKCIGIYSNLLAAGRHLPNQSNEIGARLLKEYIQENYTSENLGGISEISVKLGLSRYKILELAETIFGSSIHRHVIKLRMDKALELLMTTNLKVSEIGFHVGYSDASYFCNAFKKHFGFLPSDVRRVGTNRH